MLVCVFFCPFCTRDRGCSAHPAFPAPSLWRDNETQASGRSCRENADAHLLFEQTQNSHSVIARSPLVRRSPPSGEGGCDEAIHLADRRRCEMDCFATLAM